MASSTDQLLLLRVLQSCRQRKNATDAKRLYALLAQHQNQHHLNSSHLAPALGNYLVPMLVECGCLGEAQHIFDRLPQQNEHSWTSLISGYVRHGDPHHALTLYRTMQAGRVRPSNFTFLALVRACTRLKDEEQGQAIHSEIVKEGLHTDIFISNALLNMYCKCSLVAEAQFTFNQLPVQNAVSWTTLLAGYTELGLGEEALNCYHKTCNALHLDDTMHLCTLKACGMARDLGTGRELHNLLIQKGCDNFLTIGSTLVDMYGKCGLLTEARQVFDNLPSQDEVSWAALITGYAEHGFGDEAYDCFEQMQLEGISPDIVAFICSLKACITIKAFKTGQNNHAEILKRGWEGDLYVGNALIDMYAKCSLLAEAEKVFKRLASRDKASWTALLSGYADQGLNEELLSYVEDMQLEGILFDTFLSARCLKACATLGALEIGQSLHALIRMLGLERDPFVGNSLVDMYCKCGLLEEAHDTFNKLPVRDVVSWNTIIQGYGEIHNIGMATQCFEVMQEQGIKPDAITFTCLIVACSHANLVLKGLEYFQMMKKKHQILPMVDHCVCMVDLLARAGQFYEAEKLAEAMQCFPCIEILRALLSACGFYGKVELGLRCFQLVHYYVNELEASIYSLMVDIYTSAGRWADANIVENMRKDSGAKKKPAYAFFELSKRMHKFVVGDMRSKDTAAMLETLGSYLKNVGYVPSLDEHYFGSD